MASSDSGSDSGSEEQAPGPVDPAKCGVTGSGFSGGSAGTAAQLIIVSKDSQGRRLLEGGCDVRVCVSSTGPGASEASPIEVKATDNGDGTYSATYVVPSRGNYNVRVSGPDSLPSVVVNHVWILT